MVACLGWLGVWFLWVLWVCRLVCGVVVACGVMGVVPFWLFCGGTIPFIFLDTSGQCTEL